MSTGDPLLAALLGLESRLFDKVRGEMSRQLDELRLEMNGRFDAIEGRLERLETEYHMIVVGLRRIEEQLSEGRNDRDRIKAEVSSLKARVVELEDRIREIEARIADE